jgi:hypothetical protein
MWCLLRWSEVLCRKCWSRDGEELCIKALHACRAGVIPAAFSDQLAAQRLAICNDIGEASYVNSIVATSLLDTLRALPCVRAVLPRLASRFGTPLSPDMTGAAPTSGVARHALSQYQRLPMIMSSIA